MRGVAWCALMMVFGCNGGEGSGTDDPGGGPGGGQGDNTAPTGLEISLWGAFEGQPIQCAIATPANDAEGDSVTYAFSWTLDGQPYTDTTTTAYDSDTIPGTATAIGQEWTCTVVASDGELSADPVSVSRMVSYPSVTITGVAPSINTGRVVSSAGDLDGDGIPDFALGVGRVTLAIFLGKNLLDTDAIAVDQYDYNVRLPDAVDKIWPAGDIDGDGKDDLIFAQRNFGGAHILLGKSLETKEAPAELAPNYTIGNKASSTTSLAGVGDIDGDGKDDVMVGLPFEDDRKGKVLLYLGKTFADTRNISYDDADATWGGTSDLPYAGVAVTGVGDLDGDGLDDVSIAGSKEVNILLSKNITLGDNALDADGGVAYSIQDEFFGLYVDVVNAGDVDGDGTEDILVSDRWRDVGSWRQGVAWLFSGKALDGSKTMGIADATLNVPGVYSADAFGSLSSTPGDVDGDGLMDLLVGAPQEGGSREVPPAEGYVSILLAKSIEGKTQVRSDAVDHTIVGTGTNDRTGQSVTMLGDLDGDGKDDFAFSSPRDDDGGTDSGTVQIVFSGSLGL